MKEITNVGVNISEKSTVIWNVADRDLECGGYAARTIQAA